MTGIVVSACGLQQRVGVGRIQASRPPPRPADADGRAASKVGGVEHLLRRKKPRQVSEPISRHDPAKMSADDPGEVLKRHTVPDIYLDVGSGIDALRFGEQGPLDRRAARRRPATRRRRSCREHSGYGGWSPGEPRSAIQPRPPQAERKCDSAARVEVGGQV